MPKQSLPKFNGTTPLKWLTFKQQFSALVHEQPMPVINKYTFLRKCLQCTALRVIGGLAVTNDNYMVAINMLKNRYGRDDVIKQEHMQFLLTNKLAINDLATKDQGEA